MYDMNLLRRRRKWPHYPEAQVALFDSPADVTREYLEEQLTSDENRYGVTGLPHVRPALAVSPSRQEYPQRRRRDLLGDGEITISGRAEGRRRGSPAMRRHRRVTC